MRSNPKEEVDILNQRASMIEHEICFATFIKNLDAIDDYVHAGELYEPGLLKDRDKSINIKRYNGLINYNSGLTTHYEENSRRNYSYYCTSIIRTY